MKKGRIGIFVISNSLSGAEKRFIRIASQIFKIRRDDIILIINNDLYRLALSDSELYERIKVLENHNRVYVLNKKDRTLSKYFRIISDLLELFIVIKTQKIKIIHSVLGALKYSIFKKFLGVKVIAEITSPDISDTLLTNRYRLLLDKFDKIITVSESVKNRTINNFKKIKKDYLIERIQCSSIPFFLPTHQHNNLSFEKKENLIVYASRFIERKNPILFAKAVQKLLDTNKDWKVAVLGKGPLEEEIKRILKKYIENGRVVVEYTKDIFCYLKKSKIFVSLIYPDNYPSQSILEAMYMMNAIVATNVGNTKIFVTENNGFLINNFEVDTLYKTLVDAVSNQERLKIMGHHSTKQITEKFSSEIYLKELQKIYDELLGR